MTPNVTCEDSKCCANCTEYVFDGPFTSSVSEVSRNHASATSSGVSFNVNEVFLK